MKKIIQLILISLIIISIYFVFKIYFKETEKKTNNNLSNKNIKFNNQIKNSNTIKNLKYEVILDNNKKYVIEADSSEITSKNDLEIIEMQKVLAFILDKNNEQIFIKSDFGIYNSLNHNTDFEGNIKISYSKGVITAKKMNLDFEKNIIKLSEDIIFTSPDSKLISDYLDINLITQSIYIHTKNNKNIIFQINN